MAIYYFGDNSGALFDGDWNNYSSTTGNWFTIVGGPGSRKSSSFGGVRVAAGFAGPTSADTVNIYTPVVTPYKVGGIITAFAGTVTLNNDAYPPTVGVAKGVTVTNAIFSGVVTVANGECTLMGCTLTASSSLTWSTNSANVYLTNSTLAGTAPPASSNFIWLKNCIVTWAWPERSGIQRYTVCVDANSTLTSGYPKSDIRFYGVWTKAITVGSSARVQLFSLYNDFNSSYPVTLDLTASATIGTVLTYSSGNAFPGSVLSATLSTTMAGTASFTPNAGSKYAPTVTVPAVKVGNYLTYDKPTVAAANKGFPIYDPTVYIAGTSNDILGSGLL